MPQSWDMGQILSLPLQRKAVRHSEDYSDTRKFQLLRPGSNPRTRVPEARMLTTRPPKPLSGCFTIKFQKLCRAVDVQVELSVIFFCEIAASRI